MKSIKVLIVDDEKIFRDELNEFLSNRGFEVFLAEKPSHGLEIIDSESIDIVILDINLPEMNGLKMLEIIKQKQPEIEVIMVTGFGNMRTVIQAMRLGATDFFPKPFKLLNIQASIERTKRFVEMKRKLQHSEDNLHTVSQLLKKVSNHVLIGKSQAIHQIMKLVSKVAVSDSISVLITGESGTGKELVARAIHYLSPRKNHFFYDVNCSAVPENLFESEFFGHKKGAFTGATEHKTGWFEIANHGTLFLDEIGDLQMNLQTKFLRVLEQNKIRKVGSNIDIPVDVRIIAATNKNLQTQIEENNFREDLYYRLSNFVIHIPPLRERKEDIPPLVNHFLDSFAKQLKQPLPTIREEVFKALLNYQFPGNVRELKNMVEQAMILCEDNLITLEHFPVLSKNKNQKPISEDYRHYDLNKNIEDLEEKLIRKVLLLTNNDKQKALDYLNISRQSLSRRLEKYHIDIE